MQIGPLTPGQPVAGATSRDDAKVQDAALQFEEVLVRQLTQSVTATAGLDGSGDDSGSGDGTDGDAATSLLQSFVPDALAQAVTDAGGLGLAPTLAQALRGGTA